MSIEKIEQQIAKLKQRDDLPEVQRLIRKLEKKLEKLLQNTREYAG